ncbi:MAG: hypothetical protein ABI623_05660 [bacterium]
MNLKLALTVISASILLVPPLGLAAEKKVKVKKETVTMNGRVDSIDAKTKTITVKRNDGVKERHVVTKDTEIRNGEKVATFTDIKVGHVVEGTRVKKSESEYEVTKISKFGPHGEKTTIIKSEEKTKVKK